jgi:hypothetical protein
MTYDSVCWLWTLGLLAEITKNNYIAFGRGERYGMEWKNNNILRQIFIPPKIGRNRREWI